MFSKLAFVAAVASAEDKIIFQDDFNTLNFTTWQHELTMGGGGNWEFEMYVNNRTNSFVKDGVLHLKPTYTSDMLGEDGMKTGSFNLWGSTPADTCTSNQFYGCERNAAASGNYINPIMSARLRSVKSFNFKYGRVQISAQMPKGDWIWPAIWMLPKDQEFGQWPASGEIDIVESRGNSADCEAGGVDTFGSTLHWGPGWPMDAWQKAHKEYKHTEELSNGFHTYELVWTKDKIETLFDGQTVLSVDMASQDMFTLGEFGDDVFNPWQYESDKNAPFNKEFYMIFNVAVGGTNDYFPDGKCGKPWTNTDPKAVNTFWNTKPQWEQTWDLEGDGSAMKIDWIKVFEIDEDGNEFLQK